MDAPLPRIAESVGPLARIAVALVPDVLLGEAPSAFAHLDDELHHVSVALAIDDPFLDVQDEGARGLEHAVQAVCDRHEPLDVVVGVHAPIGCLTLVGIGGRRDDQVDGRWCELLQHLGAVAVVQCQRRRTGGRGHALAIRSRLCGLDESVHVPCGPCCSCC